MKDFRPTSETIQIRGARTFRLPVLVGAAFVGILLLLVPSSWAETLIEIRLESAAASEAATARLTAPNGGVQEARDDDGDGLLVFLAKEAGEHELAGCALGRVAEVLGEVVARPEGRRRDDVAAVDTCRDEGVLHLEGGRDVLDEGAEEVRTGARRGAAGARIMQGFR